VKGEISCFISSSRDKGASKCSYFGTLGCGETCSCNLGFADAIHGWEFLFIYLFLIINVS
jgi:hypothetical protein